MLIVAWGRRPPKWGRKIEQQNLMVFD